jgi:hypothetical protein
MRSCKGLDCSRPQLRSSWPNSALLQRVQQCASCAADAMSKTLPAPARVTSLRGQPYIVSPPPSIWARVTSFPDCGQSGVNLVTLSIPWELVKVHLLSCLVRAFTSARLSSQYTLSYPWSLFWRYLNPVYVMAPASYALVCLLAQVHCSKRPKLHSHLP